MPPARPISPQRIHAPRWKRVMAALCVTYTLLIAAWLLTRALWFDTAWPLALINTFALYFFTPLGLLLPLALLTRWRRLFIITALPALVFLYFFGGRFLPNVAFGLSGPTVRAMSLNVWWRNQDYAAQAAAIRAANADLIGFQEFTDEHHAALAQVLAPDYPYQFYRPHPYITSVALFSRYPIESAEPMELPPLDFALHAVVNVEGRRLHVLVAHLSANNMLNYPREQFVDLVKERYLFRAAETTRLAERLSALSEPAILLCDCNLADTSQAYANLAGTATDSFAEAGWGFGHSLSIEVFEFPIQRIDYVWHTAGLVALEADIGQPTGSDHLPVWAELQFVE